ncbi:unnamed protein product [Urochloa humidicola]
MPIYGRSQSRFFFPPLIPPPSILGRGDLRRENHPRDLVLVLALRSSTHEIWCSRKKANSSPRDGEAGEEGRLKEEGRFFPTRCHAASNWYASICYATTKADASSCALNTAYASANQWLMVVGNRWWDPWGSIRFSKSMQTNLPIGENSHFVGVGKSMSPPSPAPIPPAVVTIDVDDGVEETRGVKRRFWTHDEEVRLASAWLNTSKDPIHGNDKKIDSFWGQITEKFNKDLPPGRTRESTHLKLHWSQLSTKINEFNGYWSSVCKMNKSGYSDDQLMDEAQKMYTKKYKKPFAHIHWWRILKSEPKWCTSVAQAEKDKGKPTEIDDKCEARPIGREAAKAERKGKRKAEEIMDGIVILGDNINKIVQVAEDRKKEREKATEAQLEISRMNLKVAKEQKEVKMLEAYNSLLIQDTSNMTDEEKASRAKALQWMQKKLMDADEEA